MGSVLHISTECYPAAKAGGMGDVVGALPIYLPDAGIDASVIIPKYKNAWFGKQKFEKIYESQFKSADETIKFSIQRLKNSDLAFPFYCLNMPGKFDREQIYLGTDGHGYKDEIQRNIAFQRAVLNWLSNSNLQFDVLHCHDHMTGLISFMIKYANEFSVLKNTPTVFTIHNGQYRGGFSWDNKKYLPAFDSKYNGLLEWDAEINSLATAIKCSWKVNTVSPSYMKEIMETEDTLKSLYNNERHKCFGILNGIDDKLWDPATDSYLSVHLENKKWDSFKSAHKRALLKRFGLKSRRALLSYIGRMAYQKGAELLSAATDRLLQEGHKLNLLILGSGDKQIEAQIIALQEKYPSSVAAVIAYDEGLAREIYAGSDFLIMPSRFEPCGLNQLFSMRYGTIPVVRSVGGLIDTVPDYSRGGNGIAFPDATEDYVYGALRRSIDLYKNKKEFKALRNKISKLDYSWSSSALKYAEVYLSFRL